MTRELDNYYSTHPVALAHDAKASKVRRGNGWVSVCLGALSFVHLFLGTLLVLGWKNFQLGAWFLWIGVALVLIHIVLSILTTKFMVSHPYRPASPQKKRHQLLKWVSGTCLLLIVALHALQMNGLLPLDSFAASITGLLGGGEGVGTASLSDIPAPRAMLFLLLALAAGTLLWHCYVGTKSLLKDLGRPTYTRELPRLRFALVATVVLIELLLVLKLLGVF